MSGEVKIIIFGGACIAAAIGAFVAHDYISKTYEYKKELADNETKKQLKEMEVDMPPEYWTAKARQAEADAKVRQARIESDERLKMDERNRKEAELIALREFEKDAPEAYWNQKKIEAEEQTKRENERLRIEAEREATKLHNKALEESARAAERAIKRSLNAYAGY